MNTALEVLVWLLVIWAGLTVAAGILGVLGFFTLGIIAWISSKPKQSVRKSRTGNITQVSGTHTYGHGRSDNPLSTYGHGRK